MSNWFIVSTLTASLFINILSFLLGAYILNKKGGVYYVVKKLSWLRNLYPFLYKASKNSIVYPPRHFHRKSIFSVLTLHKNKIIFLGDSNIDNCEWSELFNNSNLINRGLGSDTTEGVLRRLDEVLFPCPVQIFLMVGINDLNAAQTVEQITLHYNEILSRIQINSPMTQVFVQSVLPVNKSFNRKTFKANNKTIRELNSNLNTLANKFSFQYIDLFSHFIDSHHQMDAQYTFDGIHLNGKGYIVWKHLIKQWIAE